MSAGSPTWRETAPMAFARSYHNLTLLPDGTVLASGGESTSDGTSLAQAVLPAEIWNPDTETWTTVDALQNGRLYHSTALLLPDGRVLMAGGGALPGRAVDQKNAELYSPPYLFKGARPTITTAPGTIEYGAGFDVTTPNAGRASTRSRSSGSRRSRTAFDQNQRFQFLSFTAGRREGDGAASGDGQSRSARRLHALPAERAGRPLRLRDRAAAGGRGHDRPDGADEPRRERALPAR